MVFITQNRKGNYITFKFTCIVLQKKEKSDKQPIPFFPFVNHYKIHMFITIWFSINFWRKHIKTATNGAD